ncbi:MAG: hypothetical protein WC729_03270 [Sphingomonas sp.]|jgi:hypothetical protein|uniref:hypothetical protein n=1 Tax=Sphingomonas sp. TaxID=28214 RepID=UPI003567DD71
MASGDPGPEGDEHAILPWRIVAGAFLHFAVPAYILTVPLACLFAAPAAATVEDVLRLALPFSGWFLALYAASGTLFSLGAALLDPMLRQQRRRREARDPRVAAQRSAQRLSRAITEGRRLYGDRAPSALDRLSAAPCDHADPRCQALSSDLAEIVRTSAAALASAPAERRTAILATAAAALDRIDNAVAALHAERSRLDEGDALTVARYVESRYGTSDFAGDQP